MPRKTIKIAGKTLYINTSVMEIGEEINIGDPVALFCKEYSETKLYPGLISGFADNGTDLSALAVTILKDDGLKTICLTDKSESNYSIATTCSRDMVTNHNKLLNAFDEEKTKLQRKLDEIDRKIIFLSAYMKEKEGGSNAKNQL